MRIWAFPSFYPHNYPGKTWTGIFAHRQYKGLIENGAELTVVIPVLWHPPFPFSAIDKRWNELSKINYPNDTVYDGIKVFYPRIANMRPSRLFNKSYTERYVDAIMKFFEDIPLKKNEDIFFSQWLPDAAMVQTAAHKLGIRSAILSIGDDVVVWPHKNKQAFQIFNDVVSQTDCYFVCADYLGRETIKILEKKIKYDVVHWGVDYDYFRPSTQKEKNELKQMNNIPQESVVILNVGTAIERKGWLDLLDALKIVKVDTPNFILVAVHAGQPEFDLDSEAEKRGLSSNFLNFGEVNPGSLNKIFNLSDIFCLPSHWEGLANAVIEGMSSGLPVITTNVCGHPEIIESGKNGILIEPKRPDMLSRELLLLINSEEERERLGQAARKHIVEKWGNFASNASQLYSSLLKELS